jgi:hypothetical protein
MKRLVEKARVVPYTKKELSILIEILKGYWLNYNPWLPSGAIEYNYFEIGTDLEYAIEKGGYLIDRVFYPWPGEQSSEYKNMNILQFLLVYHRKVFLFLTCVERNMILIYIGKDPLRPFVEWRLKIGK